MNHHGQIIYVVDDNASTCLSLKVMLELHGFKVETFPNAAVFLAFKQRKAPSCLILDVQMPGISGLILQETMAERQLNTPIVFITGHGNIPMSVKAMRAGAIDFLTKPFTEKKMLHAIDRAMAKSKAQNKQQTESTVIKRHIKTLSPRELEVFHYVAKGMMSKQIASKLGTVLQTIKVHRGQVMQKMQAKTVTELIHFAQRVGIPTVDKP